MGMKNKALIVVLMLLVATLRVGLTTGNENLLQNKTLTIELLNEDWRGCTPGDISYEWQRKDLIFTECFTAASCCPVGTPNITAIQDSSLIDIRYVFKDWGIFQSVEVWNYTIKISGIEGETDLFIQTRLAIEDSSESNPKKYFISRPDLVVLANSIDYVHAIELLSFRKEEYSFEEVNLFDYLNFRGFESLRVTNESFSQFKDEKAILILGGPDAPEGVGDFVREILNETEQDVVRENGSRKMFVKEDVWAENQIVMVVAGSDRWQTKKAVGENGTNVLNRLLTKDLDPKAQTWVEILPVQCGGNPWEKDWARAHNQSVSTETSDLTGYPRHYYPFIIEQSQIDIITSYFKKHGIIVSEVRSKYREGLGTLDCCACPRGDKLWFLVSNPDVYKILDLGKDLALGYKISEEPPT